MDHLSFLSVKIIDIISSDQAGYGIVRPPRNVVKAIEQLLSVHEELRAVYMTALYMETGFQGFLKYKKRLRSRKLARWHRRDPIGYRLFEAQRLELTAKTEVDLLRTSQRQQVEAIQSMLRQWFEAWGVRYNVVTTPNALMLFEICA